MKTVLKVAAVFIGTIVGAGLASGQEILLFFSKFGTYGFVGLFICSVTYIIFSYIIVKLCYKFKFKSYVDIIRFIFGKSYGKIIEYITTFFIFSGNIVMISGSGAMIHQYFNVPTCVGIFIMSLISFFIILASTKGLVAVNSLIVPCSSTIIIILGCLVFTNFRNNNFSALYTRSYPNNYMWIISSIVYSSFNLLGVTGVLCPMTNEIKSESIFIKGTILGSLILLFLGISINFTILYYSPESFKYEIPNLYAASYYGQLLSSVLLVIIWLEMLSTEIADLYSLANAMKNSTGFSYYKAVSVIILLSLPLSFIGFSRLISFLYPLTGLVGIIFIIGCLKKYLETFNK